jgi:sporulation protein YlmC with PRC-barrel domain
MTHANDGGYDLVKLGDTDLVLENPAHDVRGRAVYSNAGEEIGMVEDLYVDEDAQKVRFLDVGAGGFLGIGEKHFLVPVCAISEVTEDRLVMDASREKVLSSPPLDTDVVPGGKQQYDVSTHYRELPYSPFGT